MWRWWPILRGEAAEILPCRPTRPSLVQTKRPLCRQLPRRGAARRWLQGLKGRPLETGVPWRRAKGGKMTPPSIALLTDGRANVDLSGGGETGAHRQPEDAKAPWRGPNSGRGVLARAGESTPRQADPRPRRAGRASLGMPLPALAARGCKGLPVGGGGLRRWTPWHEGRPPPDDWPGRPKHPAFVGADPKDSPSALACAGDLRGARRAAAASCAGARPSHS